MFNSLYLTFFTSSQECTRINVLCRPVGKHSSVGLARIERSDGTKTMQSAQAYHPSGESNGVALRGEGRIWGVIGGHGYTAGLLPIDASTASLFKCLHRKMKYSFDAFSGKWNADDMVCLFLRWNRLWNVESCCELCKLFSAQMLRKKCLGCELTT